jgi:hypothetical protein
MDHGVGIGAHLRHHLDHQVLTSTALKTLLHLSPEGAQFWRKVSGQWLTVEDSGGGSVWVVSDMAEETLTEIQIPRLYGRDRTGFISRQLATRFPETPYKTVLPASAQTGLLNRLAPLRQTLLALDAKERVDQVLDGLDARLVGLWSTSGLLARLGGSSALPANLFIVVPASQSMRILFLKNRVPIISRLIRESGTSQFVAAEIIRTLRHLENTKVIEREGEKPPVMVLGDSEGLAERLTDEGMTLIKAPKSLRKAGTSDFRFALFELALQSPPGQLAPLSRRTEHLASELNKLSFAIAAATVGIALWILISSFDRARNDRTAITASQNTLAELRIKMAVTDKSIAAFPVSSELVKNSLSLERDELLAAPSMPKQLTLISLALAADPSLRLGRLDWAIETPLSPACPTDAPGATAVAPTPTVTASDAAPGALGSQVSFDVLMPPSLIGKARTSAIASLSERLAKIPGVTLQQDPARLQTASSLAGGSKQVGTESSTVSWCMVVSNSAQPRATLSAGKP